MKFIGHDMGVSPVH